MVGLDQSRLKLQVKEHWELETCGIRYGENTSRRKYFEEISKARYTLEPYIPSFADFPSSLGRRVLEIGVGAGADFEQWCQFAEHAVGVDLTNAAISLTDERLGLADIPSQRFSLQTADAETLPLAGSQFDIVYSWGVLHHTPNTAQAFREAWRVLKPGGELRAMVYHVPSITGALLYLQHALFKLDFKSTARSIIFTHLESPGTKAYTIGEAEQLLAGVGFSNIRLSTKLGPGDLLTIKPSQKYRSMLYTLIWRAYPRWLVRRLGDKFGLALLIKAVKPLDSQ